MRISCCWLLNLQFLLQTTFYRCLWARGIWRVLEGLCQGHIQSRGECREHWWLCRLAKLPHNHRLGNLHHTYQQKQPSSELPLGTWEDRHPVPLQVSILAPLVPSRTRGQEAAGSVGCLAGNQVTGPDKKPIPVSKINDFARLAPLP